MVNVDVQIIHDWFSCFPLFLCMLMYDYECKTKENLHNIYHTLDKWISSTTISATNTNIVKIILPWLYFNLLPYSNGLKKRKLKKQIEVKCYVQNTNENKHNYNQKKFYRTQIKIIKHYTFLKYLYVWRDFFLFRSNMVVAMVTLDWWCT